MKISALLLQNVVVEGVVAGHGHEGAETNPNGVKDLSCSVDPHLQHIHICWSPLVTLHISYTHCEIQQYVCVRKVRHIISSSSSPFTSTESSLSHSGTMKKVIPSNAPGSCTLLISRAIRITYGKRAVK